MLYDVPAEWEVSVDPSDSLTLGPNEEAEVTVSVRIPCPMTAQAILDWQQNLALQREAGGIPTIDVEGYIDGELVGGIELQFPEGEAPPSYFVYLPAILKAYDD
jgi:hypothetical protein